MTTLFISDLHLTPNRPDITECFVAFMQQEAIHADALYILGDLFEFWIGDDDNSAFATQIKTLFKTLTDSGVACYFIHGNRDFLIGSRFSQQTGVKLLNETCIIDLYGQKALILHGDTLCTDDIKYQAFRAKVHKPWLQWIFNRIPFVFKKHIVHKVQLGVHQDKQQKSYDIMDVNAIEVELLMKSENVHLMIHGHTHRPDIHYFTTTHGEMMRVVLGDWFEQGSVLIVKKNDIRLEKRPFV